MARKFPVSQLGSQDYNRLLCVDSTGNLVPFHQWGTVEGVSGVQFYQDLVAPIDGEDFDYPRISFLEYAINPSNNSEKFNPTFDSISVHLDRYKNGGDLGGNLTLRSTYMSFEGDNIFAGLLCLSDNAVNVGAFDGSVEAHMENAQIGRYSINVNDSSTVNHFDLLHLSVILPKAEK